MSIHAAALETNARVINLSFFERSPFLSPLHSLFSLLIGRLVRRSTGIWSPLAQTKNLPPTEPLTDRFAHRKVLFFFGWLFRNPMGFEKYRTELLAQFDPTPAQRTAIDAQLAPHAGKTLLGVYMRYKPFRFFDDDEFLISRERTMEIVEEYIHKNNLNRDKMAIIETSDHDDEQTTFQLLSRCSVIIGTNSTYCNLASWFGNVPHIVTFNEPIDWEYYRNKNTFFENKYATFAYGGKL